MASIYLSGDEFKALGLVGFAKQRLNQLRESMRLTDPPLFQSWPPPYTFKDGSIVTVSKTFNTEIIDIYGAAPEEITAIATLFVLDMTGREETPDTQGFDRNGNFLKTIDTMLPENPEHHYHYGLAYFDGKLYLTNWWTGDIEIFDEATGAFIEKWNMVAKWTGGADSTAPLGTVKVDGDRLAVVVNSGYMLCYVFDLSWTPKYVMSPVPAWSSGTGGICLKDGVLFMAWNQILTLPAVGYGGLAAYSAEDGAFMFDFEDDPTIGDEISSIDVFDGVLYACDVHKDQVLTYDAVTGLKLQKYDMTAFMEAADIGHVHPCTIAVGDTGIWVAIFEPIDLLSVQTHPVLVYRFTHDFQLLDKLGSKELPDYPVTRDGEFYWPSSLALKEVA